jgi:hypothetical protein
VRLSVHLAVLVPLFLAAAVFAWPLVLAEGASDITRKRFERFQTFQIKGVCGDGDLESLAGTGINTVRGYTIPAADKMQPKLEKLDKAHKLGLKVVLSEWMPHHGENKSNDGFPYTFDYNTRGDAMVEAFAKKVEAIGDHPAILMWGLGNEVHLDEPYLRTVNRMSLAIHERFPHHITSLTMVNAKPEHIEAVKKFAPDLDVLGIQSYSRGAVRKAIKSTETHWGKPFYMSEFNTQGPWNYEKSEWGMFLDHSSVASKVADLKDCFVAIDESPLCLGSTIFLWGHATTTRPTDFSLLLHPNPDGRQPGEPFSSMYRTPQSDVLVEHFTAQPLKGNRAPIQTNLQFERGAASRFALPGELMRVEFAAKDADGDALQFVTWILDGTTRSTKTVAGPFPQTAADYAMIPAPEKPGVYRLMVYVIDGKGGASASSLAFKVPEPRTR